jgi:hypothetical protein
MKMLCPLLLIFLFCTEGNAYAQPKNDIAVQPATGFLKISFNNLINNKPVVLYDSSYTNPFGENYTINKLKYYVSNTTLYSGGKAVKMGNDYHLINQAVDSSLFFTLSLPENKYDSIQFLLGVDSAMNTSGAQTGALDPMNDMFWTWNSGYIMQKVEGVSPQSNVVNNKFEYHIGGYSGENSALNYLTFYFEKDNPLFVKKNQPTRLNVQVNMDKFWNASKEIKISETPVCSQPGALAKQIAVNFSTIFKLASIINED